MRYRSSPGGLAAGVGLLALLVASPARAYVDPGSGSFLLQLLAAGFLSALVTLRLYWRRLRAWGRSLGQRRRGPERESDGS